MAQDMVITGAWENNLKHIDVTIPKDRLVVVSGVSGSGKSSLVFDTIAAEAMRQLAEILPSHVRSRLPQNEAPRVKSIERLSPAIVVGQRPFAGSARSTVATLTGVAPLLRLLFSRCASPSAGPSTAYAANDPQGMCPACSGLGYTVRFTPDKLFDRAKSLAEGAILFPGHKVGSYQWQLYAHADFLDENKPLCAYTEQEWQDFLHGAGAVIPIRNTTGKVWGDYQLTYEGFLDRITRLYLNRGLRTQTKANERILRDFTAACPCPACHGARLNAAARGSRLCGLNIAEMGDMEAADLIGQLRGLKQPVAAALADRIVQVLTGMVDMGLGYLNLNRPSGSLSGGEVQRLRIVRHLGSSLTGLLYILDEPSRGLHPQDVEQLSRLLLRLRDQGNTVLVAEHHPQILRAADYVIDMGPHAGSRGGEVVFAGTPAALLQADTLTAQSLRRGLVPNPAPRTPSDYFCIQNATLHNLRGLSVRLPKGVLTVVSGLAGAGKSSLICGELLRQHPRAVHLSQTPIGTTPRSTPATYAGVMDEIRRLFAQENGVDASLFSANAKGACPACGGRGVIKTEMAFMDPVTVPCEACRGTQYCDAALGYHYRGRNILEVLAMTIEDAADFFPSPKIVKRLQMLCTVGLGYLRLGQPTDTLSGGECQRVKLASHLHQKNEIYVLDEPTAGLHGADVQRLLGLLDSLVGRGNSVIVIEHNPDVICHADWVIDMGPGGGKHGGRILFEGPPEKLLLCKESATAAYLRRRTGQGADNTLAPK